MIPDATGSKSTGSPPPAPAWAISWAGLGRSGTIEMDLVREGQIVMGEAQVLSQ